MKTNKLILIVLMLSFVIVSFHACKNDNGKAIPEATITDISPNYGIRGSNVVINGDDFHSSAKVFFNGEEAVINSITLNSISATVPGNASAGIITIEQSNTETDGLHYHVFTPAKNLFFTQYSAKTVSKIDLINTPNVLITLFDETDGLSNPLGITLSDDGFLYVTEEFSNNILKMQKNGSGDIVFVYDYADGVNQPDAIAIDTEHNILYWANSGTDQIMKASSSGTDVPATMYNGEAVINYCYGLKLNYANNKIYTSDFHKYIQESNIDGNGTPNLLFSPENFAEMINPSNIFVDPVREKLYWTDETAGHIVEANMDGTGTPFIIFDKTDGVSRPDGISVDYASGKIYWSDTSLGKIFKGNLDGTGVPEELIVANTYGMILEFDD